MARRIRRRLSMTKSAVAARRRRRLHPGYHRARPTTRARLRTAARRRPRRADGTFR